MLYVRSKTGQLVPLSAVASFEKDVGPLTVNHLGQLAGGHRQLQPAARASRWAMPSPPSNSAAAQVLPADHHAPASRARRRRSRSSLAGLGVLLLMAILVIYIVLGILYESFIHPITILSGLPSAGVGALLTLLTLPQRAEHLRVRRHHHADRHREEERHHDDRLRARSAARRRQERRRKRSTRARSSASVRS